MSLDEADVWKYEPPQHILQSMEFDKDGTFLLDELKKATVDKLDCGIEALRLAETFDLLPSDRIGSTLYIRSFYSRLFETLLSQKYSILTGNPGISKSWFQMCILCRLVQMSDPSFSAVVCQSGTDVTFFDLRGNKAYICKNLQCSMLLHSMKVEKALYLMEPALTDLEPVVSRISTIITVSPDVKHFKEFQKCVSAVKLYMPIWTLDELLTVGEDIHAHSVHAHIKQLFTRNEIAKRFKRFGGTFRHVLPSEEGLLMDNERYQETTTNNTHCSFVSSALETN